MCPRTRLLAGLFVVFAGGCVSAPDTTCGPRSAPRLRTTPAPGNTAEDDRPASWFARGQAKAAPAWEWATGLPHGATRAELVLPVLSETQLASLVPALSTSAIRLASVGPEAAGCRITAVNGLAVADCNQLHAAVNRAAESGKPATVTFNAPAGSGRSGSSVPVEPAQLLALNQAAAPSGVLLRVNETGNPWAVLREDGVRCKVATQVERQHGILRVVLGLTVCWGAPAQLPREVRADCDGVPLQCLNVAQTLDALYGTATTPNTMRRGEPTSGPPTGPDAAACSFAAVSEREDYRVPSNYKRLQQSVDDALAKSAPVPPSPALVTVAGVAYPGPALLGDARALGAFLQQRQLYRPGEAEQVGWIIFSGPALRHGGVVHLQIDLGQGVQHVTFTLPAL